METYAKMRGIRVGRRQSESVAILVFSTDSECANARRILNHEVLNGKEKQSRLFQCRSLTFPNGSIFHGSLSRSSLKPTAVNVFLTLSTPRLIQRCSRSTPANHSQWNAVGLVLMKSRKPCTFADTAPGTEDIWKRNRTTCLSIRYDIPFE